MFPNKILSFSHTLWIISYIARSLEKITQNRTTIAILVRLSTIRHADCIYVRESGSIIEAGTHEALLARAGVYANLWQVQTGGLKS